MKRNNVFQDSDGGSSSDDSSSTAKKKSKKLVIPLIKKNNYNMSIEEKELVEKIVKDSTEAFSEENTNLKNIPLIQQNKIPNIDGVENEKDKLKLDLSHRPEQSTLEEYEDVSVEEFGLALMRGMGWKDGMSVELNVNSKIVVAK
ncbi:hypothetical protein HK099_004759 [Clydaea vesicula]|uniref:Spp2/MOS2 G-patch domain-containing protein n=1 Tax=Clydaea vesicula TaxID=447962 RepID=A0AAD5U012_9FUNG|nr:hypothetical protein HK099_004759 [Clydaea vesicula]